MLGRWGTHLDYETVALGPPRHDGPERLILEHPVQISATPPRPQRVPANALVQLLDKVAGRRHRAVNRPVGLEVLLHLELVLALNELLLVLLFVK